MKIVCDLRKLLSSPSDVPPIFCPGELGDGNGRFPTKDLPVPLTLRENRPRFAKTLRVPKVPSAFRFFWTLLGVGYFDLNSSFLPAYVLLLKGD